MTVPALFRKSFSHGPIGSGLRVVRQWAGTILSALGRRLDRASPRQRKAISVAGSVLLHMGLVFLLLPAQTGLNASMGTVTGLGDVNGAGTAVILIDVSELVPPQPAQPDAPTTRGDQPPNAPTTADTEMAVEDTVKPTEAAEAATEAKAASATPTVQSDSQVASDSFTQATAGAFGQNGEASLDLWNAIAPCWNRITDSSTLPATLKITFDANGGLALPPEIERDADAPITDQSLRAEAQALQALAECGAYPMAEGQQGVVVKFPAPGQMPAGTAGNSGQMAAVVR